MGDDRDPGLVGRPYCGPGYQLFVLGNRRIIGGYLDDAGLDPRISDTGGDFLFE